MPSVAKVWNGSSWVHPYFLYPKVWDGSQWVIGTTRVWTGPGWNRSPTDTQTVTVGSLVYYVQIYGYYNSNVGSIASGNSTLYDNAPITGLFYELPYLGSTGTVTLSITNGTNDGWNTMTINGTPYARTAAAFSSGTWTWPAPTNPFGTTVGAQIITTWA